MTRRTIMIGSHLGETALCENIYALLGDIMVTDGEMDEIISRISQNVNDHLPGTLVWYPYLSEVHADVNDDTEIEEWEIQEIIDRAIWAEADEWVEEWTEEQKKPYLSLRDIAKLTDDRPTITVCIEYADGSHDQDTYLSAKDLLEDSDNVLRSEVKELSVTNDHNGDRTLYIRCRYRQYID